MYRAGNSNHRGNSVTLNIIRDWRRLLIHVHMERKTHWCTPTQDFHHIHTHTHSALLFIQYAFISISFSLFHIALHPKDIALLLSCTLIFNQKMFSHTGTHTAQPATHAHANLQLCRPGQHSSINLVSSLSATSCHHTVGRVTGWQNRLKCVCVGA